MKIAYFDCFSGASGDMILGSLIDAGLDMDRLRSGIARLGLGHHRLSSRVVTKKGLGGTQVVVEIEHEVHQHHHRHLADIRKIIEDSALSPAIKHRSLAVFQRLAEAEAKVHRTSLEEVHFHEVGAMDTIIDVVGTMVGLDALGIERIHCSPLHLGSGTIRCAHGVLPVPAPATAELVKGRPVYSTGVDGELLTPTGAAILTTLADVFGPLPHMELETIGYGAGTSEPAIPNLLRLIIGSADGESAPYETQQVAVVETNIDDMNPQWYDYLLEKLPAAGALDVFLKPVQMKKNRPGTLLTVICRPQAVARVADLIMKETTSIGVRWRIDHRYAAARQMTEVQTPHGTIRVKVSRAGKKIINATPEYEDCKRIALEHGISLQAVTAAVQDAIGHRLRSEK